MIQKNTLLTLCTVLLLALSGLAQPVNITLFPFSSGFNDPVDLTHAGDDRIFVVEQRGRIWIIDQNGTPNATPFLDIDPRVNSGANERGLLGLAFHPDYAQNGYFYVNYSNTSGSTVVSRFSVSSNPDIADPNSESILLTVQQPFSNHNGGCIKFGPDGYLYIGMGDGGSGGDPQNYAQNGNSLLGKMLRIDVDVPSGYAIPPDNPFLGNASVRDEVWMIGLRNPWRFSFDRVTGDLWIGDVGQNAREEIDFEAAGSPGGLNFGWRCYEATSPYNTSGCSPASAYEDPVYGYNNNFSTGCSVTGGYVYRGVTYGTLWGLYFFTDYCTGRLWYTSGSPSSGWTTVEHSQYSGNFSSFGEDQYGRLYILSHSAGTVLRMVDNTCPPTAHIAAPAPDAGCGTSSITLEAFQNPGMIYQWYLNGSPINGATSPTYNAATAGTYTLVTNLNGCNSAISDPVTVSFSPAPTVTLGGLGTSYLTTDPAVTMSGSPAGGTYSGPGVSGNVFDPAAAGQGSHSVIYTYTDGNGCSGADTVLVNVGVVGLDASALLSGFSLAPNPGRDIFQVAFQLEYASHVEIALTDLAGRELKSQAHDLDAGEQAFELDYSEVAAGLYLLRLRIGEESYSQKLLIER